MSTITIESEDTFGLIIRYGLYVAAGFQLICLLACICLPDNNDTLSRNKHIDTDDDSSEQSVHNTPKKPPNKIRKQDKKKRR